MPRLLCPAAKPGTDGESETAATSRRDARTAQGHGRLTTPEPAPAAQAHRRPPRPTEPPGRAHFHRFQPITSLKSPSKSSCRNGCIWLDEHAKLDARPQKSHQPRSRAPNIRPISSRAELKQLQAMLAQSQPPTPKRSCLRSFLKNSGGDARRRRVAEMKDAIDATTHELGEWKTKAEALKTAKAEREANKKKTPPTATRSFSSSRL